MLVMRRRAGESFLIGSEIEVQILEVSPTRVKIGITAPADTAIVRNEVALTREQNLSASQTAPAQAIASLSRNLRAAQAPAAAPKPTSAD
jgi:carbon storage regulator